jgi:hypothetical protein
MNGRRLNLQDILFGIFLIAAAAFTTITTWSLRVGTAANMGPGYLPRAISILVCVFGLYFVVRGVLTEGETIAPPQLRAIGGVVASVAAFALLATTAGLMLASLVTIVIAGFGSRETRFVENALFGGAMAVGSVLLFVKALSLPVPIWPW